MFMLTLNFCLKKQIHGITIQKSHQKQKYTYIRHVVIYYLLCLFDSNKNKHNYHLEDSREHATKIINCEKLKMPSLTKEDNKTHRRFFSKNKIHWKVQDHHHYT